MVEVQQMVESINGKNALLCDIFLIKKDKKIKN
jgi:hypothetical protein